MPCWYFRSLRRLYRQRSSSRWSTAVCHQALQFWRVGIVIAAPGEVSSRAYYALYCRRMRRYARRSAIGVYWRRGQEHRDPYGEEDSAIESIYSQRMFATAVVTFGLLLLAAFEQMAVALFLVSPEKYQRRLSPRPITQTLFHHNMVLGEHDASTHRRNRIIKRISHFNGLSAIGRSNTASFYIMLCLLRRGL